MRSVTSRVAYSEEGDDGLMDACVKLLHLTQTLLVDLLDAAEPRAKSHRLTLLEWV